MNFQKLVLVGNASTDAKFHTSRKGDYTFATFGLAVATSKLHTTFFPITAFGQMGAVVSRQVTKGREVLVEGRVEVNQGRFNVIADRVVFGVTIQPEPKAEAANAVDQAR